MSKFLIQLSVCLTLLSFGRAAQGQAQPFSRDTSFNLDVNFDVPGSGKEVAGIIEHSDGKLLVYGAFATNLGPYSAVRFFPNGQVDPSFHLPLNLLEADSRHMDTKAYGYFMRRGMGGVSKLNHSGAYADLTFEYNFGSDRGGIITSAPFFLPDGKYLFGCSAGAYPLGNPTTHLGIFRLLANGLVDSTFAHNVPGGGVFSFTPYGPDRILLSGNFDYYDTTAVGSLCRIYLDGTLDTTFSSCIAGGVLAKPYVQPDGKILVAGIIELQGSTEELGLLRLHLDGSLDTTFNNFGGITSWATAGVSVICPTSDGGFLLGGYITQYQGQPAGNIVKVDANGYLEPGVFTGTGVDSSPFSTGDWPVVRCIVRGSNDYYYVGGHFNGYNGQAVQPIIRLKGPQTVSGEEELEQPRLMLYPNPATETVRISWQGSSPSACAAQVCDLLGRPVLEQPLQTAEAVFNISALPAGVYLVSVTDLSGKKWQQKLVVQR